MNKYFKYLLLAISLSSITLHANDSCYSQEECCYEDQCFFVKFDTLIWKGTRNHMDYAIKGDNSNGGGLIENAKLHKMDFDWDLGFRLGLGYYLPCNGWDLSILYTRFHTEASGSSHDSNLNDTDRLFSTRWASNLTDNVPSSGQAEKIKANLDVEYDLVDLLLSYSYSPCCNFHLSPSFGARMLILDQDFSTKMEGGAFGNPPNKVTWNSDLFGLGIVGNYQVRYQLCQNLAINGLVGASAVVSSHKEKQYQIHSSISPDFFELKDEKSQEILCGSDFSLNIEWLTCVCDYVMEFTAGYEIHCWNHIPTMTRMGSSNAGSEPGWPSDTSGGSLGFHGFFLRAVADF